jgi:hypothetical protein
VTGPDYRDEPPEERQARSEVTVGELVRSALAEGPVDFSHPEEPLDLDGVIARIGPERWAELRQRRDKILGQLRKREEG